MAMTLKKQLADHEGLQHILDALAANIAADNLDFANLAMIGILQHGAPIASYLAQQVGAAHRVQIPVSHLDITLYRDDMIESPEEPYSRQTEIPFPIKNREIILVDDVLFTGRTVRAALANLLAFGRPRLIKLAVAVDRGHRELPIRADYTGLKVDTTRNQGVRVRLGVNDTEKGIFLYEQD
ncbi:MAG: bifunctional pyr operon transcriptional regulator/uracil phosphoribosyltransferase PyrR [Acidobacteria bacterium]|nr:bifunctional pyr operon transcriptional regulator/uracil phosphoribosyltransferase PyrR [Acidobacteriota bacterium]MCB9398607.1 bifunctional pyr operon transcriptional regulator/uracil phosphoribosyltransferase PyrR [Acidobacteriota bacterium]